MKISSGFIVRHIADSCIVIPVGEETINFKGMITLNGSGEFLWKQLLEDRTEEELAAAIQEEYNIDTITAIEDVKQFVAKLSEAGFLQ